MKATYPTRKGRDRFAAWITAGIPYAVFAFFLLYGLAARMFVGHWPRPFHDPIPSQLDLIDQLGGGLIWVYLWSFALGAVGILMLLFRGSRTRFWKPISVYWLGAMVTLEIANLDPFSFLSWFFD
jgi:hypothetical protein